MGPQQWIFIACCSEHYTLFRINCHISAHSFAFEHFAVKHLFLLSILLSIFVEHFVCSAEYELKIALEQEGKTSLLGVGAQSNCFHVFTLMLYG